MGNNAEQQRAWRKRNPGKSAEYNRKYRAQIPEAERRAYYKAYSRRAVMRGLGLTIERYNELLTSQGKACAICLTPDPGNDKDWRVDHDHVSGKVRGLLCHKCNVSLGLMHEDITALRNMIRYIERHK